MLVFLAVLLKRRFAPAKAATAPAPPSADASAGGAGAVGAGAEGEEVELGMTAGEGEGVRGDGEKGWGREESKETSDGGESADRRQQFSKVLYSDFYMVNILGC